MFTNLNQTSGARAPPLIRNLAGSRGYYHRPDPLFLESSSASSLAWLLAVLSVLARGRWRSVRHGLVGPGSRARPAHFALATCAGLDRARGPRLTSDWGGSSVTTRSLQSPIAFGPRWIHAVAWFFEDREGLTGRRPRPFAPLRVSASSCAVWFR